MDLTPELRAALAGHRITTSFCRLLNTNDQQIGIINEFQGGNVEQNQFATIQGGGTVNLKTSSAWDIDWGRDRIQPVTVVNGIEIPWGVYLIEKPTTTHDDEKRSQTVGVSLLDKTSILTQAVPPETISYPAGANVVEIVGAILTDLGQTRIISTPSPLTLPASKVYPVTEEMSWLRIVNDLLSVINYRGLHCDEFGNYRIDPYVSLRDRGVDWVFEFGADSLYLPRWVETEDWYGVPNHVRLVTQGDSEIPGMVANAYNEDPNSRFSTVSRGRVISFPEAGVDAADQATLDALAERRLESLTTSVTNIEVAHAPIPLWPGSRVAFRTPARAGVVGAVVTGWTLDLSAGGLMQAKWREIL